MPTDEISFERGQILARLEQLQISSRRVEDKLEDTRNELSKKIETTREELLEKISELKTRMAVQEFKSGMWGGLSGLIAALMLWAATMWGKWSSGR